MKRFLGSLFVIAGVLRIGLGNALAAEPSVDPLMMLAESEAYSREQIIIIASPELLKSPFFSSLLSSYVYPSEQLLTSVTNGNSDSNKNSHTPKPAAGTNGKNTQSGGTDGVSSTAGKPANGSAGGVAPPPTPIVSGPTTVEFSQVYPNTSGDDKLEESITMKNTGSADVNLAGWMIKDASDKTFTFPSGSTLPPGQTLSVGRAQTGIALNNDTDKLLLIAPDQKLIDSVTYENAKQGEPYLRVGSVWKWASDAQTPEPKSAPAVSVEPAQPVTNTPPIVKTKKESAVPTLTPIASPLTISQAKEKPDDTFVKLTGVATVVPGTLGKQFFYLQDETGGLQVYKHEAVFPDMQVGTSVTVEGVMSTSGAERRVKVSKTGSIQTKGLTSEPTALTQKIQELTTEKSGMLLKVSGVLANASSDLIQLEEDGKTLDVGIGSYTGIDTSLFTAGAQLEVTGVLRPSSDGFKLMPRSQQDIIVLQEKTPVTTGTIDTGKTTQQKKDERIATLLASASGTILAIWVVRQLVRHKQKLYANSSLPVSAETVR